MYSHGHTSTDTLGDVMDQERREAISALGEDNLQALRDMTREALPEVDTTTENTIAAKGAEGLENLSLIISQRIHFVELLDRAAAMIDPDRPEGTASYEARLDWLAKWREVVGR